MIMAQNEETLYFDNIHPEVRQESKDKTQNAADKATWKKVADRARSPAACPQRRPRRPRRAQTHPDGGFPRQRRLPAGRWGRRAR